MLKPEQLTAIIDSREQAPLIVKPLNAETGTLQTGDYTLKGLEDVVRIERKSLSDLLGCVGRDRERFEREIERLAAFPIAVLLIESSWPEIEMGQWASKVTSQSVIGSLLAWQTRGVAVHMAHDHERAGRHAARLLYQVAKNEWRKLQALLGSINSTEHCGVSG